MATDQLMMYGFGVQNSTVVRVLIHNGWLDEEVTFTKLIEWSFDCETRWYITVQN